jgi:katanin p60 ATPase-containing subunit A1
MKNKERVFLLAASNLPWDLDVALLRRVEKRVILLNFLTIYST